MSSHQVPGPLHCIHWPTTIRNLQSTDHLWGGSQSRQVGHLSSGRAFHMPPMGSWYSSSQIPMALHQLEQSGGGEKEERRGGGRMKNSVTCAVGIGRENCNNWNLAQLVKQGNQVIYPSYIYVKQDQVLYIKVSSFVLLFWGPTRSKYCLSKWALVS